MNHIRREKMAYTDVSGKRQPLIAFRYSKEVYNERISIKFIRNMMAEIYIHLRGEGSFFIGDRIIKMNPGDILVYNINEIHFSTMEPDAVWERFVVFFLPDHFNFIENMPDHLMKFFYERNSYEHNLIILPEKQKKYVIDLCHEIDRYDSADDFDNQFYLLKKFIKILQCVNQGYINPSIEPPMHQMPKTVKGMLDYINKNFRNSITLEMIAKEMNISKSSVSSSFKRYVGLPPYEYLLNVRIDHVKRLLSYGESIADACYDTGFSDYSHFIQFFRKRVGMTPYQYQKMHLGKMDG